MRQQIEDFMIYLVDKKDSSENTISAYRNDLGQFLDFAANKVQDWDHVDKSLLSAYVRYLQKRKYASSTVARKVAAVKSFFHFMLDTGRLKDDPTATLDSPKVKKRLPKILSPQEIEDLLDEPVDTSDPKAIRDKAFLELLYATGMRVSELVALDTADVQIDNHTVYCVSRSNTQRKLPISERASDALETYLERGRPSLLKDPEEVALFLNHRGQRLTRQGLWLIIKSHVEAAGLSADVTPHTLRHSFATHLINGGKDLKDVQRLLGHANISTTQIYAEVHQQKSGAASEDGAD
jgi:integrase/recombinase XerD